MSVKGYLIGVLMAFALSACNPPTPEQIRRGAELHRNEVVEQMCIHGYLFTHTRYSDSAPVQILNNEGHGIRCE